VEPDGRCVLRVDSQAVRESVLFQGHYTAGTDGIPDPVIHSSVAERLGSRHVEEARTPLAPWKYASLNS